jgi:hypothetical protein
MAARQKGMSTMNLPPTTRLGLLAISVLAACVACSSSGSGAAAGADAGTASSPRPNASTTRAVGVAPATSTARRDVNTFCGLARRIGLANIAVTGGGTNTDAATLLRGIDELDAAAPAEIKTDFHAFDHLEHTILKPSGSTPPDPGADIATAMGHVSQYLSHTCRLG